MFRFEREIYLYFLFLIPVFTLIFYLIKRNREFNLKKFGSLHLVKTLIVESSRYKPIIRFALMMFIFASIILAIANPQIGSKVSEVKREGKDIIIALDISNSMKAQDIKPSRLERAKQTISRLIDKMVTDRIGIIIFAGEAFTQLPLTTDYSAAKLFLSVIETDLIPVQGTAIAKSIDLAVNTFQTDDEVRKSIIVISDGEDHEEDAVKAAENAAQNGFYVHTIGMGTLEGAPIPLSSNNPSSGYIKDREGSIVTSRLIPDLLQKIATAGNGEFVLAGANDANLDKLMNRLSGIEDVEYESQIITDYDDHFQYAVALAILFILFEILLLDRENKFISKLNRYVETGRIFQNDKIHFILINCILINCISSLFA